MPSMTGIFTSVSSRSKPPFWRFIVARTDTPSAAVVSSWPSSWIARITKARAASSSSAISILAIALLRCSVLRGQEAHHHVAGLGRRCGDLAVKFQPLAGTEDATRWRHGPGIDFLSGGVARGKAQARHFDRLAGLAHNRAFHDQG